MKSIILTVTIILNTLMMVGQNIKSGMTAQDYNSSRSNKANGVVITNNFGKVMAEVVDLNLLNKKVLQKFSSLQAYTIVNGHYIPIISTNISDESQINTDSRKFYIQSYDFTMLGFLIDEEEFEVKPAINRISQVFETELNNSVPNVQITETIPINDLNYEIL
jgi:hypothetical protein